MSNKIALVSSFAPPHGGAATVLFAHAKYVSALGHTITVVSMEDGFAPLSEIGCKVHVLKGLRIAGDWLLGFSQLKRLWAIIEEQDAVCLHSQFYLVNVWAAFFSWIQKKPVTVIHHGYIRPEWRNVVQSRCVNTLVNAWIVLREEDRDWLKARVPRLKPLKQISNGVDYAGLKAFRAKHNGPCKKFVYCGGLIVDKGLTELTEVVRQNSDLSFSFVGSGPFSEQLEKLPNVTLYGQVPHERVLQIVSEHDCLVLPSYHEVMPMVILEALALHVPVIMTDLSKQIRSLVEQNGILIKPKSVESLSMAIEKASHDGLSVENPEAIANLDWQKLAPKIAEAMVSTKP